MADGTDLPWMKFYPGDFMDSGKVKLMDPSERGIYISLLCHEWKHGPIPDDPRRLAGVCNASPDQMRGAWPQVRECFDEHPDRDGYLVNQRLEEERKKAIHRRESARKAARASAESRSSDSGRKSDRKSGRTSGRSSDRNSGRTSQSEKGRTGDREKGETTEGEEGQREQRGRGAEGREGQNTRRGQDMGGGDEAPPPESELPEWVDGPPSDWPSPSRLPKDESGDLVYPVEFEEVWADRVPRDGKNPKKRGYRQYRKSRRGGMSREQADLALDYRRREAERKGDVGERQVEQFATFFGQDDLWRDYLRSPDPADVHEMSQADRRLAKRRAELEAEDLEQVPI